LGSTIRPPLTGSDAEHAAVQASGIEKSVVGNIQNLFVQEGPRVPSAICNSPVHEQWLLHVAVLVGRCSPALAVIVIVLILQSQKLTALYFSVVYRLCCGFVGFVGGRIYKCQ
jgi:hypothetical protein